MQPVMRTLSKLDVGAGKRTGQGIPFSDNDNRLSDNENRRVAPRSATVLVVEDNVLVRVAIAAYLRDIGYKVIETATAEEARAAVETRVPISLIFADIDLPEVLSGTDLTDWLRGHAPGVKVILTSSGFHPHGALETCDSFVPKPYLAEEVAATVKELIGG
jgi:CheY-like chemotaxis protein